MYDRDAITLTSDWRNQGLPKPIYEFMEKWEKNAADAMKTYKFGWPAKLVETRFRYEGKKYSIVPETFGIPDDLCECFQQGPWVTEKYGGGFDDDLRLIPGVTNVGSVGFLD